MTAKNKNLRFLKEKIEKENIPVPDALNAENIQNLLDDKFSKQTSEKNITHSKRFRRKAIISLAACLAVTVSAISLNNYFTEETSLSSKSSDTKFESYDDLKETIDEICKAFEHDIYTDKISIKNETTSAVPPTLMENAGSGSDYQSYEKTYTQVDGVDEGDIIKNDGKYIYIAYSYNNSDIYI